MKFVFLAVQSAGDVSGDHTPLNLSLVGVATSCRSSSNGRDVTDEKPEVTRRRKAELMTSLRLVDNSSTSGLCVESLTPETDGRTDWNGDHLLYDPPPTKRRRTDDDKEEEEEKEEKNESEDAMKM